MATAQPPPVERSAIDAAATDWYAKRNDSSKTKDQQQSDQSRQTRQRSIISQTASPIAVGQSRVDSSGLKIGSDITAWQTTIQSLPPEFKNTTEPAHPLAVALVNQPTLRQVEWNPYRHQGGFVPRTAHDFASMMIFICGQINPNPCRNCLLKNGPFARCVVSPPEVLSNSTIRHACASCTYQNQYKKCTNDPITEEEMQRSMLAKGNGQTRVAPFKPRMPKSQSSLKAQVRDKLHHQQHQQKIRKTTTQARPQPTSPPQSQPATAGTFADKLHQVRAWSPQSRRRMEAEALQWQAAIATVEAERFQAYQPQSAASSAMSMPYPIGVRPTYTIQDDGREDTDMSEHSRQK